MTNKTVTGATKIGGGLRFGTIAHVGVSTGRGSLLAGLAAAVVTDEAFKPKSYKMGPRAFQAVYEQHLGNRKLDDVREAAINMARESEKRGFHAGLEAAIDYLLGTAADYQQGVDRNQCSGRKLTENERRDLKMNIEKIALLKGQAQNISEIRS